MLPRGFLGTRADLLMDIVVLSLAAILPLLAISWTRVKRREYEVHRGVQLWMGIVLFVVVLLFETDLRMAGGIFELVKGSRYAGTAFLNGSIWIHTGLSIFTSLTWAALIVRSLQRFGKPPRPNDFSRMHRIWGKAGMIGMALTGLTGIELYVVGFSM